MLLFRNQGGAEYPKLELQSELVQDNPADREQGTAQPGRASNSVGSHRSEFQETDFHELEQARFAALTAAQPKQSALNTENDKLNVGAPPGNNGDIRQQNHKRVEKIPEETRGG